MPTVIVVQARMGSTRLPGKVLRPIAGRPMLSFQLERLRRVKLAERLVVATTTNPLDAKIVSFCRAEGVEVMRGSEHDVLARYDEAANQFAATTVVRVTSDCPLIDPELVDDAVCLYSSERYDYVSNMLDPSWPYGMAVEVMSRQALAQANLEATDPAEREHVTPFIYRRPQRYRLKSLVMKPDLSHHRWTVDTQEDFELISRIFGALYPRNQQFKLQDVLALLDENRAWQEINRHVQQKTLTRSHKES